MLTLSRFLAALCVVLVSCSDDHAFGDAPAASTSAISVKQAMQVQNFEREVVVKGKIDKICQDEGCWFTLFDSSSSLHISFLDEQLTMPMSASGEVLVRGIVKEVKVNGEFKPQMIAQGMRLLE